MKIYFVESKQDSAGFRERCHVQAESPEKAARMGSDQMGSHAEYIWELPAPDDHERAYDLYGVAQWRVRVIGNHYTLI